MRKLVWIVLLSSLTSALLVQGQVTCADTDNGPESKSKAEPYVSTLGKVKYGLTEKQDECVSGSEGVHRDPSKWVREYFCGGDPVQRTYEDFDCTRYGYTGCQGGICIGKPNASTVTKPVYEGPACGNEKTDAGEQCDPPDKICYLDDKIGICARPGAGGYGGCQCKVYTGGSGTATPENATPVPVTTPAEQPPTTPVEQPPAAEEQPPVTEQPPVEQPPAERAPLPTEELEPAKGIGVTRAITNAVKQFFAWIGSWFG